MTLKKAFICLLFAGVLVFLFVGIYSTSPSKPIARTHSIIAKLTIALENYRSKYGKYPEGENKDIYRQLIDKNEIAGLAFDKDGNCLDEWNITLKIYYKDGIPVIISAGPNREFDDIGSPKDDDIRNY